jgi:hypothetical protein
LKVRTLNRNDVMLMSLLELAAMAAVAVIRADEKVGDGQNIQLLGFKQSGVPDDLAIAHDEVGPIARASRECAAPLLGIEWIHSVRPHQRQLGTVGQQRPQGREIERIVRS